MKGSPVTTTDLEPAADDVGTLLELAVLLARRAGTEIVAMRDEAIHSTTTKSSPTDPVTAGDEASEAIIVGGIRNARPDDGIVGEEGTNHGGSSELRWIIDPIDGTNNYLHGLPLYSVSIAVASGDDTIVGVVYNPVSDELYTATADGGAFRNGEAIRVSEKTDLATSLIATGFSYKAERRMIQAEILTSILPGIGDVRRLGSAALDLCTVAAGQVDGYYEEELNVWDYAAGKLIVEQAGGLCRVSDDIVPGAELVLAGPPTVAAELTDLLRSATR